jgi:hypothetical protein
MPPWCAPGAAPAAPDDRSAGAETERFSVCAGVKVRRVAFFAGAQAGARGASPAAGSAGLGLAIVKGFSGLMGAQVSARNRPDRSGAIFSIVFPPGALA